MRALLLVVLLSGCGVRIKEARAIQPNPLWSRRTAADLAVSEPLAIYQRVPTTATYYMLYRPPLMKSSVQFTVASRDRLRFHVGIARLFEDDADAGKWHAWLEDDRGHHFEPDGREVARIKTYAGSRWLKNMNIYVGRADFTFYARDLFSRDTRKLTFVMARGDEVYRFVWEFGEGKWVENYGEVIDL